MAFSDTVNPQQRLNINKALKTTRRPEIVAQ